MKAMVRSGLVAVVAVGLMATSAMAAKGAKAKGEAHGVQQIRNVLDKLDLSADQKTQTDQILSDLQGKIQEIHSDAKSSGDKSAAKEKARSAIIDAREKIVAVLNDDQKAKMKELMKEQRAEHKAKGDKAATTEPSESK